MKTNECFVLFEIFLFFEVFSKVWAASCPVLVKQVHRNLSKTLWHPNAFKLHMIDHHETPALWIVKH